MEIRSLVALYGPERARHETVGLIAQTTAAFLATFCP
jgi:hypothetical protein